MPRASTLNLKSTPGRLLKSVYSIVPPARIVGAIDATRENFRSAAAKPVASLRFGTFLNASIRNAATNDTLSAYSGSAE